MSKTFTYTFGNGLGSISVTTADTAQPVDTSNGTYSGFPILSGAAGVSGNFNGQTVTGLFGNSGAYQDSGNGDTRDNAIFVSSTQGASGRSYDGIDNNGIEFTLQGGNHVKLYQTGSGGPSLFYATYNPQQAWVGGGTAPVTATNYDTAVCFVTGTRIRVRRDGVETEVPVEALQVGDLAVTASGALRPITWIGHRDLKGQSRALPYNQQPIRIRAGAFGPGLPERELRLSPGHPVLVGADEDGEGGHLVPIMCLINGTSIAREPVNSVTYWHVELNAHDILLAEGLPAESYFDMSSRAWFAGADGALVDPELVPTGVHGRCRPVAVDGPLVDAERLRLDAVFAAELAGHGGWNDAWLAA